MKLKFIKKLTEDDLKSIVIHQTTSQLRLALGTGRKIIMKEATNDVPTLYYLKMTEDEGLDDWTIHALSTDIIYFLGKKSLSRLSNSDDLDLFPDNSSGDSCNTLPRILQSKISRDPLNIGGQDLKMKGIGNLVEFKGKISWYREYPGTDKVDPGNYVGIMITPEEGMIEKFPNVTVLIDGNKFGREIFTVHDNVDLSKALYCYLKVFSTDESHIIDVNWSEEFRERFIISFNEGSSLQLRGEVIKESYGYAPTGERKLEDKVLTCNGNPVMILGDEVSYRISGENGNITTEPRFVFNKIVQGSTSGTKITNTWIKIDNVKCLDLISGSVGVECTDTDKKYFSSGIMSSRIDNLLLGNVGVSCNSKLSVYSLIYDSYVNKIKLSTNDDVTKRDSYDDLMVNIYNTKLYNFGILESKVKSIDNLYLNIESCYIDSTSSLLDIIGSIRFGSVYIDKCIFSSNCDELDLLRSGTFTEDLRVYFVNCKFPRDFRFNMGYSSHTTSHGLNGGKLRIKFQDCVNTPCVHVREGLENVDVTVIGSKTHFRKYSSINDNINSFTINEGNTWKLYGGYVVDRGVYLSKFGKIDKY